MMKKRVDGAQDWSKTVPTLFVLHERCLLMIPVPADLYVNTQKIGESFFGPKKSHQAQDRQSDLNGHVACNFFHCELCYYVCINSQGKNGFKDCGRV